MDGKGRYSIPARKQGENPADITTRMPWSSYQPLNWCKRPGRGSARNYANSSYHIVALFHALILGREWCACAELVLLVCALSFSSSFVDCLYTDGCPPQQEQHTQCTCLQVHALEVCGCDVLCCVVWCRWVCWCDMVCGIGRCVWM